jgi:hypothetical protein
LLKEVYNKPLQTHGLNNNFYHELLYIFGLEEVKAHKKPIIEINEDVKNTFAQQVFHIYRDEKNENESVSFEKTLELIIIWLNRILFIKLFEAQLVLFNSDEMYRILDKTKITASKKLSILFFEILGKKDRKNEYSEYEHIPYLNSSLFEIQEAERTISINQIENESVVVKSNSVIRHLRKKNAKLLDYLIDFLNSYCFSSNYDIHETEKREIIDAAVLGLIFEKINGYKDGAFFTPPEITEYMCKEVIERAAIIKINAGMKWKCTNLFEIKDKIETNNRKKVNEAINELRICDPAVGSGHFLVSALNRIIALKYELGVLLMHDTGDRLKDYQIEIENDVLVVKDGNGDYFNYNRTNNDSRRVQATLFSEKRTIIENCLFGVDINPKAVYITQLRLWIELLKNAYYENGIMETLPNIDINIKKGNSLINKVDFAVGVKAEADEKTKKLISDYKSHVKDYKRAASKSHKNSIENSIQYVKELIQAPYMQLMLNNESETAYSFDYKNAKSFEWAFEFPEVLNAHGKFMGFDVVMGNPPYGVKFNEEEKNIMSRLFLHQDYQLDSYLLFIERGIELIKDSGILGYIIPNTWISNIMFKSIRKYIFSHKVLGIAHYHKNIFQAVVDTEVLFLEKNHTSNTSIDISIYDENMTCRLNTANQSDWILKDGNPINIFAKPQEIYISIVKKIEAAQRLSDIAKITVGMKPYQKGKGKPKQTKDDVENRIFDKMFYSEDTDRKLLRGSDIEKYLIKWNGSRWISYGEWLAEPRLSANFDANEKIVLRQTGDSLVAAIDREQFVCMNNMHVIHSLHENYRIEFVLAIINSDLMNYYYQYLNPEKGEALAEVKKTHVEMLRIISIDYMNQERLAKKAMELMNMKIQYPSSNTSTLENEIDRIVYELYGLTEEEIKIVEGAK